ncbi:MAG: MFS transporter [Clostridia bacterium]|nr:MFS transporter [Clostridia bacterium]
MSNTKKELSTALKYVFGVGDAGFVLMSNVETFYFMSTMTGPLGFTPTLAGLVNSVFSIVDACLSWMYGAVINGTKAGKHGRTRSWLVLLPWIVPFIFAFQFIRISENEMLSALLIIIAAIASHVCWNFPYVANSALVSVVGKTPEDKATLASSRATWNNIGNLIWSYVALPFAGVVGGIVGAKNQWAAVAFIFGIIMAVTYFAHFKMTEGYEDIETEAAPTAVKTKMSFSEMLVALFTNPQLIFLIIIDLAKWCVNFVVKASAVYYFRDAMGSLGTMSKYTLGISLGAMVGAFVARYLVKALSARTSAIVAYIGMTACLFGVYVSYASINVVIACMTGAFFCYGMALAIAPALYADVVTYTTAKTGKNAAGWIMGLQNIPLKAAIFLRGVIIAAALNAAGWVSGVVLEGTARQTMTIPFALVPAIFCAVGLVLLLTCYKLTKEKVAEAQAKIDAMK